MSTNPFPLCYRHGTHSSCPSVVRGGRAIRVGTVDESLVLYADDLLLFLKDPGASLQAALALACFILMIEIN